MDVLEKMNRRFGSWYEKLFGAGSDDPELRPREILRRIVAALEDKRQEGIDGQVYIPNVCTVRIAIEDEDQRQFVGAFLNPDELAKKVLEKLTQHSYKLRGGFVLAIEEVDAAEGVAPLSIETKFDANIIPSPADALPASDNAPRPPGLGEKNEEGTIPFAGGGSSASLMVIGSDGARSETPIGPGGISVGRGKSAGNDLVIDDTMISKRHLRIVLEGGRFLAYDEHSTNGTTVEGAALTPGHGWPLADGDELRLGQTRLLFSTDAELKTAPAPKKINSPSPGPTKSENSPREGAGGWVPESGQGPIFNLVSSTGERFALASEMLLGRALTDDIVVTGDGVSAQHARLTVRGEHLYLEDLDTPGGTQVNGSKIAASYAVALHHGDAVTIGATTLTLERGGTP